MKKSILFTLASSTLLLFAGCNEEWNAGSSGEGYFNPVVSLNISPTNSADRKVPSRSSAKEISVNDLALRLTSTATGVEQNWTSVADFDPTHEFNVGTYTLEAFYGDKKNEGFELPYYYGKTQFSIRENVTTPVALEARLGNAMLSITFTDAFTGYFTDYSIDVVTAAGNTITWMPDENRPVYAAPGTWSIVANVTKPNGTKASYQALTFDAQACYHYHLSLNVNDGNVGNAELVLSFDDDMEIEDVVIDLSQDLQNTPAPEVKPQGFAAEPICIAVGSVAAEPLQFLVTAHGGIAHAMLETSSPTLVEQGWPASVDLIAPGALSASMTDLGFKEMGLWKNPDKMALAELTDVVSHIRYLESSDNISTFTLTVTDRLGRSSEPVELKVAVEKLQIELSNPSIIFEGGTEMQLDMTYNGSNPEDVVFEVYTPGVDVYKRVNSEIVGGASRAAVKYQVKLTGLPDNSDVVKLRASVEGLDAEAELEVERTPATFGLSVNENDVFAHYATVSVIGKGSDISDSDLARIAADCQLMMNEGAGSARAASYEATVDELNLRVEGLKPSTTYDLYITYSGVNSNHVKFTTEAAAQLPNAGMEEWNFSNHTNYNVYYPWKSGEEELWNTYNPVTTSQRGAAYAYIITSGTIQTSDKHTGSSAAQIRTVGWGSGNTASASVVSRWRYGTCKHLSAGQLFLGNWTDISPAQDATPNYGLSFASRPSSISFWYKYAVMNRSGNDNGQRGVAFVQLIGADGSILSEETVQLAPNASYSNIDDGVDCSVNGSYAQKSIPLTYSKHAPKCEKIIVVFKSTQYSSQELEANKNENHLRPPKPFNTSDNEYLGSSLLIDDITLNY